MDANGIIKEIIEQAASVKTQGWEENVCIAARLAYVAGMRRVIRSVKESRDRDQTLWILQDAADEIERG